MHKVVSFDEAKPSITLANGGEYEADVIIAADGIRLVSFETGHY